MTRKFSAHQILAHSSTSKRLSSYKIVALVLDIRHSNVFKLDNEFSSGRGLKRPAARELDREKDFPKRMFDLEGPKLNVLIRGKSVAHLKCGSRSCSWALYCSFYS